MEFPESRIISARRLAQFMKESSESSGRFCFILGSGASVESGIPSGNSLQTLWMDCLMGKADDRGMPAMDASETQRIADALYAEKELGHPFDEIKDAWLRAKRENKFISSKYYFDIYKLRFHANLHQGYSYLEKIMERCDPSLGYHTLAKLLTENNLHNLVITTNFDSLVEDALFLYTDKKPLVVGHESLVGYMEANIQRPIVAKVHRGLMYAPFNSPETTQELKPEWQNALSHALNTYTPIVIGYSGGDHSLMSFLEQDTTAMPNGVYWCYCGKCDPSDLPETNIQEFVKKRNGYFVAIDGFDALMVEIGKTMYGDAIRPGLTAKKLEKALDDRIQKYNEQWDKLNENEEIKETLQAMNAAEQQEEEQRERRESLTAQDHFRRGFRAAEEGRKPDAINEYSESIEMNPDYAPAYNNRGNLYVDLGDSEKAREDYNKAIELDPNYAFAYNNRGLLYYGSRDFGKALEDYNKAIEIDPNYASAYHSRGVLYKSLGDSEKACEDYNKAIELNPNDAGAYYNRGVLYADLGDSEKAFEDYNIAIKLNPDYASAYNNRGVLYRSLGDFEKALEDYNKAIEAAPRHALAYNNRGVLYKNLGDFEKALEDYNKAIELDPNYIGAYYNRGILYESLGELEKAIEDYAQAIQLDPQYKEAYQARANVYAALGQEALAEADRKSAAEL